MERIWCRVCYSDSALQDCPVFWWLPGSLGAWGWAPSLISLFTSTGPTYPFRAILYHQWELLDAGLFSDLHMRKTPMTSTFPCVWGDTSVFEQISDKGKPVDSGGSMYLLTWLYSLLYFSYLMTRAFASGLNPKHPEFFFSALFAMGIPVGQIPPSSLQTVWENWFNPAKSSAMQW